VLGTDGDAQLGGDDFDAALAAWLQQQLAGSSSSSSDAAQGQLQQLPPEVLAKLLEAAEAAKCRLTEQQVTSIQLDAATAAAAAAGASQSSTQQQQQQQVTVELSRQQMHAATAQLRQRLWNPLQALADDCKLAYECGPSQIEQLLAQQTTGQTHQQQQSGSSSSSSSNGSSDPYAPKPRKLTAVLLVGGATHMPIIQQGLQTLTGLKPR
jgi:molecular chaperone DnaK